MEIPESEPGVTQARKLPGLQRESITKLHLEGGAAKSKNLSLAHSGQEVAEFTLQTLEIVPRVTHDRKPYVFTRASYLTLESHVCKRCGAGAIPECPQVTQVRKWQSLRTVLIRQLLLRWGAGTPESGPGVTQDRKWPSELIGKLRLRVTSGIPESEPRVTQASKWPCL